MKQLRNYAKDKLKFTPLTEQEEAMYQGIVNYKHIPGLGGFTEEIIKDAEEKLRDWWNTIVFIILNF